MSGGVMTSRSHLYIHNVNGAVLARLQTVDPCSYPTIFEKAVVEFAALQLSDIVCMAMLHVSKVS